MKFRILFFISVIFLFHNLYSQEMKDIDGNIYKTAKIGVQNTRHGTDSDSLLIWTTSNLNVSKFRNGESIMEAKTNEQWEFAYKNRIPAWCYVNNDSTSGKNFGKIYNYYAIASLNELAPRGWHISSDVDWGIVYKSYKVGKKTEANLYQRDEIFMSTNWKSPYGWGYGNNKTGLDALPSGYRLPGGFIQDGAYFWYNITEGERDKSLSFIMILGDPLSICEFGCEISNEFGFSVRCVKDW